MRTMTGMRNIVDHCLRALAICMVLLSLTGCSGRKTLDLNNYVNYSFSGFDGYGSLDYRIDYEALERDIRENSKRQSDDVVDALIMELEMDMYGSWNRETDLSNGDSVTYRWDINDETCKQYKKAYGLTVKCEDLVAEVSGLQELKEFDPFENFQVDVTGYAGGGQLTFSSDRYPGLSFSFTP